MYFNMDEWSQEIIQAKDRRYLPVLYFPCLKPCGMGVIETVHDGKKMAEVMAEVIRRYPNIIAAMTGMDLSVDVEAFGARVKFKDTEAPTPDQILVTTPEEAEALAVPDVHAGRVDVFLDAVKEAQKLITDRPIFGGQLGPFSLAANLMEVQKALLATIHTPDMVQTLLRKSTAFLIKRAQAYKEAGANGILLAEPTAGMLSPKQAAVFSDCYVKEIVDAVQDSSFYVVLHDCGKVTKMTGGMYGTGAKGLHFGNSVQMPKILDSIPGDVLVFGNVDPALITIKSAAEVTAASEEVLEATAAYPNFVFSSGCDIPPLAPLENCQALADACVDFNRRHGLI